MSENEYYPASAVDRVLELLEDYDPRLFDEDMDGLDEIEGLRLSLAIAHLEASRLEKLPVCSITNCCAYDAAQVLRNQMQAVKFA